MKTMIHSPKVILATCAGVVGTTAFANPLGIQSERGRIESIDTQAKTMTVTNQHSESAQIFVWNDTTKFLEKRHPLSKSHFVTAADLKAGEEVRIHFQKENDRMVAETVVITPEHHSAPAKESSADNQK